MLEDVMNSVDKSNFSYTVDGIYSSGCDFERKLIYFDYIQELKELIYSDFYKDDSIDNIFNAWIGVDSLGWEFEIIPLKLKSEMRVKVHTMDEVEDGASSVITQFKVNHLDDLFKMLESFSLAKSLKNDIPFLNVQN